MILFDRINIDFLGLNYDIFYLDFMQLELNKKNLSNCIEFLHSADISNLNNKFKNYLIEIKNRVNSEFKEEENNVNINIKDIINIKDNLIKNRYYKEAELIEDAIILLESRKSKYYKYKNQNICDEEFKNLNKLIDKVTYITNLNINLDLNILKRIDYNIYKDNKWNRFVYFDFIKPISNLLKEHIRQLDILLK